MPGGRPQPRYECALCSVVLHSGVDKDAHERGRRHAKAQAQLAAFRAVTDPDGATSYPSSPAREKSPQEAARSPLGSRVAPVVSEFDLGGGKTPSSLLHEYAAKNDLHLHVGVAEEGTSGFEARVSLGGVEAGRGIGVSKKVARQRAAAAALHRLGIANED